jgi:two-component system, chemotaxis family, chemotaxis protein CheY
MPSVLIADDAAFMRMMLKNVLVEAGFDVVGEAENGAVAVARYRELNPDLTTMDITMPEMDGLAALREIREQDPGARVVMCSAMGQQSMVIESIQAGARDFIVKPFQPDRVLEAVQKALA